MQSHSGWLTCGVLLVVIRQRQLVPKVPVGMPSSTLRVVSRGRGRIERVDPSVHESAVVRSVTCDQLSELGSEDDAERRGRHSHAERGNESGCKSLTCCLDRAFFPRRA
jgi:hypothetical protein